MFFQVNLNCFSNCFAVSSKVWSIFQQFSSLTNNIIKLIFSFNFADEPVISIHKCPSPITEGSNTTLYCHATGNPVPVVTWIYQETGVILSSTEELVFTSIDRSQAGSYKCHAFNGIGSNSTRKCSLDVFCKYDLL